MIWPPASVRSGCRMRSARKYPNAAREPGWQYLFPSPKLSTDPRSGRTRRHHVDDSVLQRAVRSARVGAGIVKPATLSHLAPLVRHASAGGGARHPHRAGAARTQGRDDHADLHARTQSGCGWRAESAGSLTARAVRLPGCARARARSARYVYVAGRKAVSSPRAALKRVGGIRQRQLDPQLVRAVHRVQLAAASGSSGSPTSGRCWACDSNCTRPPFSPRSSLRMPSARRRELEFGDRRTGAWPARAAGRSGRSSRPAGRAVRRRRARWLMRLYSVRRACTSGR